MNKLLSNLYTPEDVKRLDQLAIESGIPGYTLMRRAGQATFDALLENFPETKKLLVLCGAGNNAGDGYVVARLAQQHGFNVYVISLIDPDNLQADAKQAYLQWQECAKLSEDNIEQLNNVDLVVDALLGTGLGRKVDGRWKVWIDAINASVKPVLSIDVPSGLDACTGSILGVAVRSDVTVSFIGLKTGLFTGSGKACCGHILFDSLGIPEQIYDSVTPTAELLNTPDHWQLEDRTHDTHKGQQGHVLVIGGNTGMPGAAILAARAALRSGAGRVSVVTRAEHIVAVASACPEAMVTGSANGELVEGILDNVSCIAIGPGLGRDGWAARLLHQVITSKQIQVLDADALNLIAECSMSLHSEHIITPHPGEAARLLSMTTSEIQFDRFQSIKKLHAKTGGVVVLKGSGSLVFNGEKLQVCPFGNPAMATAGMGDVLTGVIAALLAQGLSIDDAAAKGVCIHALAADRAAAGRTRGLLASDAIEALPEVMS